MYKKTIFIIILTIVLVFYSSICLADNLTKIDNAGNKILTIFRKIGFWLILIKCIQELIQCAMNGGTRDVGGIIVKYVLIYGAFYFVPWMLRLVEGIF